MRSGDGDIEALIVFALLFGLAACSRAVCRAQYGPAGDSVCETW